MKKPRRRPPATKVPDTLSRNRTTSPAETTRQREAVERSSTAAPVATLRPPSPLASGGTTATWPSVEGFRVGSRELLEALGHRPSCAALTNAGLVASCDCPPSRLHDPAIVVGVVMHYARIAMAQQAALPTVVVELLMLHVHAGDPACIMVADLLSRNGLIDQPLLPKFGKRIRS